MEKFDILKIIDGIYNSYKTCLAEKKIFRNTNTVYDYIATHFFAFIKTIILIFLLYIVINDIIDFEINNFLLFLIIGLTFLLLDKRGFNATKVIILKFFKQMVETIKSIIILFVKFFKDMYSENNNFYKLVLKVVLTAIVLPIMISISLMHIILVSLLYSMTFLLITILNNESFSFIITYYIFLISNLYDLNTTAYYIVSSILIYFIVDYRYRVLIETLELEDVQEIEYSKIVGNKLIRENEDQSLYLVDGKYYLINNISKNMKIYVIVQKNFEQKKQEIIKLLTKYKSKENSVGSNQK